jgi:pyruvate dehydrogenase E1 component alpha subunit
MAWEPDRIGDAYRAWHERQDAVLRFVRELVAGGAARQDEILAIDEAARDEMSAAVTFALESPYPAPEEALDHVFA